MTAVLGWSAPAGPRVLLLVPARTYRAADFLLAAVRMGLDLVIGSDGALPLGGCPVIPVSPGDPDGSTSRILARGGPVAAVVAADTPMLVLAAAVAARMGLPHNPVEAVLNATDKTRQRQRWAAAAVAQPQFEIVPATAGEDSIRQAAAAAVGFPCVVKAVSLSASQGILRADDTAAAVTAARRIRHVLAAAGHPGEPLLVEEYLPAPELSIDGLLGMPDVCSASMMPDDAWLAAAWEVVIGEGRSRPTACNTWVGAEGVTRSPGDLGHVMSRRATTTVPAQAIAAAQAVNTRPPCHADGSRPPWGILQPVRPAGAGQSAAGAPYGRDADADQAPGPGAGGLAAAAGLGVSRASGRTGSNSSTTFPDGSSSRICLVPMPVTMSFRK